LAFPSSNPTVVEAAEGKALSERNEAADALLSCPCIVFALDREAMAFWRHYDSRQLIEGAPCRARVAIRESRKLLVLETGLGQAAMETAIRWVLGELQLMGLPYRPPFLLLAGFSGALQAGQAVGDLILATEVIDEHLESRAATWPIGSGPAIRRGRVLTTEGLIADPARKFTLGEQYQALAVDMESAVAARLCHQSGVPFGCLRAISDDVDTPLSPRLVDLLQGGRPSAFAVLAALARRPAIALELWALARNTRLAAHRLAAGIQELFATMDP
jgi:adenosylhomocysteine nucleosidase